ncbi:MAG: hypothetical protein CFE42_08685 [Ralstonia sp. PBBBR1]|nr:MAG: hypothetical protein CFE42_08685 [Ralstonia sp. PBBBR1]
MGISKTTLWRRLQMG